jgi:hypothetical protein
VKVKNLVAEKLLAAQEVFSPVEILFATRIYGCYKPIIDLFRPQL